MKCYLCKKQVSTTIRHWMPAKDKREKNQFRDICETCYPVQKKKEGYILNNNIWRKKEIP